MGCLSSGLNALYNAVNEEGDMWITGTGLESSGRWEGGFACVYLVKEVINDIFSVTGGGCHAKRVKDTSHLSDVKDVNMNIRPWIVPASHKREK